ncbi:PAAR domain-containing protein [Flavobacterium sp.]|uniref:PAAR domain-containing protein n=1 Tax=Flavobacterium sp. TaxID=239 RepID=UPI003D0A2F70
MPAAARVTDMHTCPMVTGTVPHVGGPVIPGSNSTVIIAGMPAAVVGDSCVCTGPTDAIVAGSGTVMIGGKPAVRMGDTTSHGGVISVGCPTVNIGG